MAKGTKTGGKDFKPGVSGNPNGRPPIPEDVRAVRAMSHLDFDTTLARLAYLRADDLERIAKSKSTPALERAFAKCLYLAGRSGDPRRLEAVLTRMWGRPQATPLEAEKPKTDPHAELSDEELEARSKEIAERIVSRKR